MNVKKRRESLNNVLSFRDEPFPSFCNFAGTNSHPWEVQPCRAANVCCLANFLVSVVFSLKVEKLGPTQGGCNPTSIWKLENHKWAENWVISPDKCGLTHRSVNSCTKHRQQNYTVWLFFMTHIFVFRPGDHDESGLFCRVPSPSEDRTLHKPPPQQWHSGRGCPFSVLTGLRRILTSLCLKSRPMLNWIAVFALKN